MLITENKSKKLTGEEVWAIVSPILSEYFEKGEEYLESYVKIFSALYEMDDRKRAAEELSEAVCDKLCKYPDIYSDAEELHEMECAKCVLNRFANS